MNDLSLDQVYELIAMNREMISGDWNFFLSVHLALLGVLFLTEPSRFALLKAAFLAPGYLGFMYMNYQSLSDNYAYGARLLAYAKELGEGGSPTLEAIRQSKEAATWVAAYLPHIYITAAAFGLILILTFGFGRVGQPPDEERRGLFAR